MSVAMALVLACALCVVLAGCGGSGVSPKNSLEDYTWKELSSISAEISKAKSETDAIEIAKKYNLTNGSGKLDGTQTKSVKLNNGLSTYVQIAGFYHDDKADGSGKAGITFIFGDVIAEHAMNPTDTSEGGWEASAMRSWLAVNGMNMLPSDLKDLVVEVKKLTNNAGGSVGYEGDASVVTSTADKLWLFSFMELTGGYDTDADDSTGDEAEDEVVDENTLYEAEGRQYQLFKDLGVDAYGEYNQILCKPYENAGPGYEEFADSYFWWERTPYLGNYSEGARFLYVWIQGDPFNYYLANFDRVGVVPGFCL